MRTEFLFRKLLSYMYPDDEKLRACVVESINSSKKDFLKVEGFDYLDDFKGLHSATTKKNYLTTYAKIIKVNNFNIRLFYFSDNQIGKLDDEISLDIEMPLVMEFKDGYMQNFAPVFSKRDDLDAFIALINDWKNTHKNSKSWEDKITEITRLAVYLYFNNPKKED